MDKINIEYNKLINYVLQTCTNDKENKRQIFLDKLNHLKAEGKLEAPNINNEKIERAIRTYIYQYFYNQIIDSGNDCIITVYKDDGEEVTFSLLEALSLKEYLNREGRYR